MKKELAIAALLGATVGGTTIGVVKDGGTAYQNPTIHKIELTPLRDGGTEMLSYGRLVPTDSKAKAMTIDRGAKCDVASLSASTQSCLAAIQNAAPGCWYAEVMGLKP